MRISIDRCFANLDIELASRDAEEVGNDVVLGLVVVTALAFDFTNGFHDTGNAMATTIATGALRPRIAVALSGVLNLVGAFLSLAVAATIASGLVDTKLVTLTVVAAGLAGAIVWNLLTWFFGIPSSSSQALIGGVIGAMLAAAGSHAVKWHSLVAKVILPAVLAPVIAVLVAATGTWLLYRISRGLTSGGRNHGFRIGQIGSASMVSLAHGTNDAQKTMGVITLALIANGTLPANATAPFWVILTCALAISLGTYVGGWRVIRTLGKGLMKIESPQGMAAQSSSAAVILLSASFGYALSTTHVATGSIVGTGLGKKGTDIRWNAGIVGAAAYGLASAVGGSAGVIVDLLVLVAISAVIYARSRASKVNHANVNDEWTGLVTPAEPQPVAAA